MTTLTIVMIVGFLVLIGFLVTRFPTAPSVEFPAEIKLPDGTTPIAFTQTSDWYAVVSDNNQILIYSRASNTLIQTIDVSTAE